MLSYLKYLVKRRAYPLLLRSRVNPALQVQIRLLQAAFRDQDYRHPEEVSCNVFTYHGEDGLLLYLITHLREIPTTFVDIGSGDCVKSNCALPAIHLGWKGLFIDANPRNISIGKNFYSRIDLTKFDPPSFLCSRVSPENINQLVGQQGITGDVGLLSIDIDGDDYWIWKAIDGIRPWIVIIEARIEFGDRSLATAPGTIHPHPGASVQAICRLGLEKGYELCAHNRQGYNLIFVRKDLLLPGGASGERIRILRPEVLLSDTAISKSFFPAEYFEGNDFIQC
jgi:hypothetical protein